MTPRALDLRARFLRAAGVEPDDFQLASFEAIEAGRSVLVSAPTGAGKTLVAAYAVYRALKQGSKAFYTTPLKALSNQKYLELRAAHGSANVGLLTGDTAIGPEAPAVVMTTEVLRNMLLAGSDLLSNLQTVVLDEVHFLQDPYRGGVWEEVLVLTPPTVTFVCLSATVANAHELGAWLTSVRGPTTVVVESERPVRLRHHLAVTTREGGGAGELDLIPLLDGTRPGKEALRLDESARRLAPRAAGRNGRRTGVRLPFRTPRRSELVEGLDGRGLLPAIVFIFSRAACDDAVAQCVRDGLRLTERAERREIRRIAEAHVEVLSDDALDALSFPEWSLALESGIAAHHAGLVPAYREAVEECFAKGLLPVVFATETLSLGINMPARTVAIERFEKYGGAGRAPLSAGEYAQLTGRAGRRGMDSEGHAVVLWSFETAVADIARTAVAPPPDLRSAFRPTYNLVANLVRTFDRATALELLERSFAQWQADAATKRAHGSVGRPVARHTLAEHLERRLGVLQDLRYVDGWRLTGRGEQLCHVYHEGDLLVAEILANGVLRDAEPSVLSGVLSALVFERRHGRRPVGGRSHHGRGSGRAEKKGRVASDRLGERRRGELTDRISSLEELAGHIRAVEEDHHVARTRQPTAGIARAVASWARGASLLTVLEIAGHDAGGLAPGDFVRSVKQLVDLLGQVAAVTPDPDVSKGAREAIDALRRDVVAAGGSPEPTGEG